MSGVNKCIFIGRLGKDPEVKNLQSGASVANFSIAVSEKYKDKTTGEAKEITEWINLVLWRGLADIAAKYLHKGDMIYVEGKFRTRSWEKDGTKHYTTEIVVDSLQMLSGKSQGSAPQASAPAPKPSGPDDFFSNTPGGTPKATPAVDATDDLPF
jgi:single-strand DNA-binding protein